MKKVTALLLAAGESPRAGRTKPAALWEVLFHPVILWVADACSQAGIESCRAVLGEGHEQVRKLLPDHIAAVIRQGDGHPLTAAADHVKNGGFEDALLLRGDAPFISPEDIKNAYELHKAEKNAVTAFVTGDNIDAGASWVEAGSLPRVLEELTGGAASWQDLARALAIVAWRCDRAGAYNAQNPDAALYATDGAALAQLNETARKRVTDRLLQSGVEIPFPDQVVVGHKVKIGEDTTILPGCILKGETVVGPGCEIGPNTQLAHAVIGSGCKVTASFVEASTVEDGAAIGPMANIRPGCRIGPGAKIGDFVEVKGSRIGAATSIAHLSYVGDSDVGERCNLGCGIVTVNYDGAKKYRTAIGDGAFIGCNANLIAPVSLGDRAYCAAGTTVTGDVPADALVIGRARQTIKENWNAQGIKYKKGAKGPAG